MQSGHPWQLTLVEGGQPPEYPFTELTDPPQGYTWDDIQYVIGGYNWKARFIDKEGYIITDPPGGAEDEDYPNQYNYRNRITGFGAGWVQFHAGEEDLPYDCGSCHTTGYTRAGNQGDLPGLVGTWAQDGVRCEACHGPGAEHVTNPAAVDMRIDRDSEACTSCHQMDPGQGLDVRDGFIQHHDQYGDLSQGKHKVLQCVDCHDPHLGVEQARRTGVATVQTPCSSCHWEQAEFQKVAAHINIGFTCTECHMPEMIQSAWGKPETFTGDMRTHRMVINPRQVGQFTDGGAEILPEIGLDYACRHCHGGPVRPRSDEELITVATGYHNPPAP